MGMFDSNILLLRLTFEFGLLRRHHYPQKRYRKILGTEGPFTASCDGGKLRAVQQSTSIQGASNMKVIDLLACPSCGNPLPVVNFAIYGVAECRRRRRTAKLASTNASRSW